MIRVETKRVELTEWQTVVPERAKQRGWRYGHLAIRRETSGVRLLEALLLNLNDGSVEILSAPIPNGAREFPSITSALPAAHWAEREIGDTWGLLALGHPRWKSLIFNDAWPPDYFPFSIAGDFADQPGTSGIHRREIQFMAIKGEGVHEIPVGPIHAGIIEPGHFRFSCLGEVIANLEIRLGYQHRGIEKRLTEVPWQHARHVAESASSDSTIANALALSEAIEGLFGIEVSRPAAVLRTIALEIERLANHLGDLGALASDIGFALGAGLFGRLRGAALGLAQTFSGSRFQRGFVCPGGLAWETPDEKLRLVNLGIAELKATANEAFELLFGNPGVQERMQGVGVLQPSLAEEFGMVGPAARSSGSSYDSRRHFEHGLYPASSIEVVSESAGDAWSRANLRRREVLASLDLIDDVSCGLPSGPHLIEIPDALPSEKSAVGIVEAWRGELIHWISTDSSGCISRYAIRDPSFQNWTGLAIAARKNLVADFPLINKSFNLSYSGNDR